jgi:hypothetical protein
MFVVDVYLFWRFLADAGRADRRQTAKMRPAWMRKELWSIKDDSRREVRGIYKQVINGRSQLKNQFLNIYN